jgi:hypothetical protein
MAKVQKSTDSSSLPEVVDRILDKGIVIDAWVKVSLVGIELLPTFRTYQKHFFDLKCSPLKFTKRVDYKNLQQLQLGSSRLNSRNG